MSFAKPSLLYFGILVVLAAGVFLFWAYWRRRKMMDRLGDSELVKRLCANTNWRGRRWQTVLWLLTLLMLVTALARPLWGTEFLDVQAEGLQIIVALDVSESMLAEDVDPNRLEMAKRYLADLIARLNGNEIGLVLFSGASFQQVPLTTDYAMVITYLNYAGPDAISRPGTVIGPTIGTAMRGFNSDLQSQKVLILVTDGEDRESDPLAAAQVAAENDVIIYTLGVGTAEGAQVPLLDAEGEIVGYKTDAQGNTVNASVDEPTLKAIAETTNGRYFLPNNSDMDDLLNEISTLQTAPLENEAKEQKLERFQIFLGLALIAFILAEFIPDRVGQRRARQSVRARRWRPIRRPQPKSEPSTYP